MKKENITLDERTLRSNDGLLEKIIAFGTVLSRFFYVTVKERICPYNPQFGFFRFDFSDSRLNQVFEIAASRWNLITESSSDRDQAMSVNDIETALVSRVEKRLMTQAEAIELLKFIKTELEPPIATSEFLQELAKSPILTSWIERAATRAEFQWLQNTKQRAHLKPQDLLDAYENTMKCVNPGWTVLNKPRKLKELDRPLDSQPDRLLGNRFLVRGALATLVGPTGIGKSSFVIQATMCFAAGVPCLGIFPARPLRTLVIQAENDEGDLAEMRDGVINGLGFNPQQQEAAGENVHVLETAGSNGKALVRNVLVPNIRQYEPDLLVIDPALGFLGGDTKEQVDVSAFLRGQLWPVAKQYGCGIWVVHHMNRPPANRDRMMVVQTDYSYAGSGSAEWANCPRAILTIRPTTVSGVFELIAPKRGNRLGWTGPDGNPTIRRFIRHSRVAGFICWLDASADEVAEVQAREGSVDPDNDQSVVRVVVMERGQIDQESLISVLQHKGLGEKRARRAIKACAEDGTILEQGEKRQGTRPRLVYTPSGKVDGET